MSKKRMFKIAHKSLKNDIYRYSFEIDSRFFANYEASHIKEGSFVVDVILDKRDSVINMHCTIKGSYAAICDRCTANIMIDIEGEDSMVFKLTESEVNTHPEEVQFIDPKSTHIELDDLLYEMIHVLLPMVSLRDCEADDYQYCDHEVLDKLDAIDGAAPQAEEDKDHSKNPLWEQLKGLNLN